MSDFEVCPIGTQARLAQVEAERDALLEALRNLRDYCARQGWLLRPEHSGVMDAARAVIAKAQGGGNG